MKKKTNLVNQNYIYYHMKLSKQDLLQQFSIEPLGQEHCQEDQWKKLLSEYTAVTVRKRTHLRTLESSINQMVFIPDKMKFSKIVVDEDYHKEHIDKCVSGMEEVKHHIQGELDRGQQYQSILNQLKREYWDFKRNIVDMKSVINLVYKQDAQVYEKNHNLRREQLYLESEVQKGEDRIQKEKVQLQGEIEQKQYIQKEARHEVSKAYKILTIEYEEIEEKQQCAQQLEEEINTIDYELELKRLAKIDSQRLLLEIEEITIIMQSYLGKGFRTNEEVMQLSNHEYWVGRGRNDVEANIQQMGGSNINFLYSLLQKYTKELSTEQFSLNMFLQRLGSFFNYCDGNVRQIIDILIGIYEFEVIYDVTLRNRHEDLSQSKQSLLLDLRGFQLVLEKAQQADMNMVLYQGLSDTIHAGVELRTSTNPRDGTHNNLMKDICQSNQVILWRFLVFLTHGMQRQVSLLRNLQSLVTLESPVLLELFAKPMELFTLKVHDELESVISTHLEQLYIYPDVELRAIVNSQKQMIYAWIKNDFVMYNWGSLERIGAVLHTKIEEFLKLNRLVSVSTRRVYLEVVQNFTTLLFDSFIELNTESFQTFQESCLQLLDRFIDVSQEVKKLSKRTTTTLKMRNKNKRRTEADSPSSEFMNRIEAEQHKIKQEGLKPQKGLFGMELNFKQSMPQRKCTQYDDFFGNIVKQNQITEEELGILQKETANLETVYDNTMEKIADMQEINIYRKVEIQKLETERQQKKFKHYMTKTSRFQKTENDMGELIKLSKQLLQNLNSPHQSQSSKIIKELHLTYTGFHSRQRGKHQVTASQTNLPSIVITPHNMIHKSGKIAPPAIPILQKNENKFNFSQALTNATSRRTLTSSIEKDTLSPVHQPIKTSQFSRKQHRFATCIK